MQRFKNIVVVINPEGGNDALMARARWLAQTNGAALTLIHVIDTTPGALARIAGARAKEVEDKVHAFHAEQLADLAAPLRAENVDVKTRLLDGVGFIEIIRHVLRNGNDLVMKAADRTPVRSVLAGPDLHLLRKCPTPVWILNSAAEPNARRIAVAVDPDPSDDIRDGLAHKVMQMATSLARHDEAKLDVVHAWYLYEESALRSSLVKAPAAEVDAMLKQAEDESADRLSILMSDFTDFDDLTRVVHVKGIAEDVISEHAETERVDTLVLGTLGRAGLQGLFIGNAAETVLNRVSCSVLAVKPEGFMSPVTLDDE